MNRNSNSTKNIKAKPVTPKCYEYTQVDTANDSNGHSTFQVHNRTYNSSFSSVSNGDGGSSNSTTSGAASKTGKDKHVHGSFRVKESDNVFQNSREDSKSKYHFSYSKSYNDDGRGNSNQPPTKSPLQGSQSFSKSYLQGGKSGSSDSDSVTETTAYQHQQQQHGSHKGKLFTQPFVPQSQYQNGQHRYYSSSGGKQQQQQQQQPQSYYSSAGTKYQSTSPILTVGQSPYTSTPHPGHYSHSQAANPGSPQPIHPQLSPSLPAPSVPIPIPHSWTAPGIPHYYAVHSPVYDSQQLQYHQYHPQYLHHSPHTSSPYTYYTDQSLPPPSSQSYQHQHAHQPTSPLIHQKTPSKMYTTQNHQPQHVPPSAKTQSRTSKAIPIINPDTMTPVQADIHPGHTSSSSSLNNNKLSNDKKDGKLVTISAWSQFIDPAIKEQEEREQQEREQQEREEQEQQQLIEQQQQQVEKETVDILTSTSSVEEVFSNVVVETTSDLQKAVEVTSIGSNVSPKTSNSISASDAISSPVQHTSPETITPNKNTNNVDADQGTIVSTPSLSDIEKVGETDGVIQYDPAFLMQFMPLCLDTTEDLSSFQNILDAGEHGRYSNGGDKRQQHFGGSHTDRNNIYRPGVSGNNSNKNYSRSAPGGISILANQMTATNYQGRSEMGKFIGGRTLTGRTNNNGTIAPTTTNNTTSSNINNLINTSINNATAFGGAIGDSTKMQRDGSFTGRTKYPTALSGRGPPSNNSNNINTSGNKRYPHHDHQHQHQHHHYHHHQQQCGAPTIPIDQVAPLEKSVNRWVPPVVAAAAAANSTTTTTTGEKDSKDDGILTQEEITRKIKALLNKLTLERFDTISDRIIGYAEQSTKEDDGQSLRTVIQLIFEKACDEPAFASMWAQLCRKLYEWIPADIKDVNTKDKHGEPVSGIPLYCKYLFSRCQYEFEKGWKLQPPTTTASTTTVTASTGDGDNDGNIDKGNNSTSTVVNGDGRSNGDSNKSKCADTTATTATVTTPGEAMLTDEYYTAAKIKRRGLGLVQFIGELYCRGMLSQRIMYLCLLRLCDNGAEAQEEEVESLCKLLTTIGADIDQNPQTMTWFEDFFKQMQNEMYNSPHLSSRVKFMIMDVVDLRKNNWVPRNGKQDKPKTIAEIHEEAERAKLLEKEAFAKRSGSSRGGGSSLQSSSSSNQYGNNASSRQNYRTNGKMMKKGSGSGSTTTPNDSNSWNIVNNTTNSTFSRHHEVTDYSNFGRTERARPKNTNLVPSYSPFPSLNRSGSTNGDDGSAQKSTVRRKPSANLNDTSLSTKAAGSTSNMFSALGDDHSDETEQRKKLILLPRGSTLPQQHSTTAEQKQLPASTSNSQLKRRIKNILAEYYELADIEEVFISIKEILDQPQTQTLLAVELLAVVEMKEKQVVAVSALIPQLYKADLLDKQVMIKAFQEFMNGYEDLVIDVPQAPTYIARLLVQAGIELSEACAHLSSPPGLEKVYAAMLSS